LLNAFIEKNKIMMLKKTTLGFFSLLFMVGCKTTNTPHKEQGFVEIFDGKTLNGWEGDSTYWRVENGNMVGEITPKTLLKRNSFIIWRGGVTTDFELKVEYKVSSKGNSGINYRSEQLKDAPHSLKGYQSDIDGANKHTGQNYEERGRTFLALRGQKVLLEAQKKPIIVGSLGHADSLIAKIKPDWNAVHLIVKGNRMQHFVNGVLMSDVTDNDTLNRKFTGLLGVQVHVGPPMTIEYRHFRIKQ
jgi:Domain of Unknown Function (DUF1080)